MASLFFLIKLDSQTPDHYSNFAGIKIHLLSSYGLLYGCFYSILHENGYLPLLWISLRIVLFTPACFRYFNSYLVLKYTVINTPTCVPTYGWYSKCSVSSPQTNLASSVVFLGLYTCTSGWLSTNSARLSSKFIIHFNWLLVCSSHYRG